MENLPGARGTRPQPRALGAAELHHLVVALPVGEVHVETAVSLVLRMEGEREHPLLTRVQHAVADVEERAWLGDAAAEHDHPTALLDHEQQLAVLPARRVDDLGRFAEAADLRQSEATNPVA